MKRKRIEKHLKSKFDDWLSTIDDEPLRKRIKNHAIITGGSIVSLLLNERVNDYDVYFTNVHTAKMVAEHYLQEFLNNTRKETVPLADLFRVDIDEKDKTRVRIFIKSAGVLSESTELDNYQYFEQTEGEETSEYVERVMEFKEEVESDLADGEHLEENRYRPIFITSNGITLSNKIQIVIRFTGSPRQIHDNFDFAHVTNYWSAKTSKLFLRKHALETIITKELYYFGSRFPICSLFRLRKFLAKGWTITAGQILKIALQIGDLNLDSPEVLEEQLIGVDVAYFTEIIKKIRSRDPKRVDKAYLVQLLDETF
jgi:hypothetical protein